MMKLKKLEVDQARLKVKKAHVETKEERHLQPEDLTRISQRYEPILKQIEGKLQGALDA